MPLGRRALRADWLTGPADQEDSPFQTFRLFFFFNFIFSFAVKLSQVGFFARTNAKTSMAFEAALRES